MLYHMRIFATVPIAAICLNLMACATMNGTDAKLNARVVSAIEQDPSLAADDITVQTHHNEVTLVGVVPTELDRIEAAEIAARIPGVSKIWNQIGTENR